MPSCGIHPTFKHEAIKAELERAFREAGSEVVRESRGHWERVVDEDTGALVRDGPMRADLRVERGAAPGLSACYIDPSVASPLHATRIQTLQAAFDARWTEKVNRYRPVFGNHYPFIMSPNCTFHRSAEVLLATLARFHIDTPALKTRIAFKLLSLRAQAYTAMFDVVRVPRRGVDCVSMSSVEPPPQGTPYADTSIDFGSPAPFRSTRRHGNPS